MYYTLQVKFPITRKGKWERTGCDIDPVALAEFAETIFPGKPYRITDQNGELWDTTAGTTL